VTLSTEDDQARPHPDPSPRPDADAPQDDAMTSDSTAPHPEAAGATAATPRRHVLRRALISLGVLGLVVAVLAGGALWYLTDRYAGNIHRVAHVFDDLDAGARPAPATPAEVASSDPVTFLLVGSDTREKAGPGQLPGGRSDAIMIARFTADRAHAQVISIPRDSWVEIPGHGRNKINAAYSLGGPTLLIATVEQLTHVRIDHYVTIDFTGITRVTDDLGGVDVVVAETTSWGPYEFTAGVNHLDGDQARWYLGQRHGLEGGDFDRVRRQQQYLQAMFTKLFSSETFTDPRRLDAALLAVTSSVVADNTLGNAEILSLAYSLRGLTPDNVAFYTAPVLGTGREGPASVVYLDTVACERMWSYLRTDSLARNAAEFENQALPVIPR
jgi:LCP family protein required for cell wall assembly